MGKKIKSVFRIIKLALIFNIIFYSVAFAESMPVPVGIQAALFLKILAYDKTIKENSNVKIGIFSLGNASVKAEILSSFKALAEKNAANLNFSFTDVSLSDLNNLKSDNIDVLYITPGNRESLGAISKATRTSGTLTLTGVPEYVEEGMLSVSIGVKENRSPEIVVNLPSSKAEGRDFSSQLLKLCKIIK